MMAIALAAITMASPLETERRAVKEHLVNPYFSTRGSASNYQPMRLLDINRHGIRQAVIHREQNVDLTFSGQTARQPHIGLIQPGKACQSAREEDFGLFVTDGGGDGFQRATSTEAPAEEHQEDLIACGAEVNWQTDEAA